MIGSTAMFMIMRIFDREGINCDEVDFVEINRYNSVYGPAASRPPTHSLTISKLPAIRPKNVWLMSETYPRSSKKLK
jgi:hypothetical protein